MSSIMRRLMSWVRVSVVIIFCQTLSRMVCVFHGLFVPRVSIFLASLSLCRSDAACVWYRICSGWAQSQCMHLMSVVFRLSIPLWSLNTSAAFSISWRFMVIDYVFGSAPFIVCCTVPVPHCVVQAFSI